MLRQIFGPMLAGMYETGLKENSAHEDGSPARDLLSAAEELTLSRQMEAGALAAEAALNGDRPDGATPAELAELMAIGTAARRRYIEANLGLVGMVVSQIRSGTPGPDPDLYQEGCVGLMVAVDRYDPQRGCRFATYALYWIRAYVGAANLRMHGALNLPTSRAAQLRQARGVESVLTQQLGRQPHAVEVASELGRPADWTQQLLRYHQPVALDGINDIGVIDPGLARVDRPQSGAAKLLARLTSFERQVIELRCGFSGTPRTYAEIAGILRTNQSRIRRTERRAVDALRAVCTTDQRAYLSESD